MSAFTLEPLTAAHACDMFGVLSDPAIYEFENAPPASEDALRQRYARLERRLSPDGRERWLNWVIRLPDGALAGYVQATVWPDGTAQVAYELASRHWRRGLGSQAVSAMLADLRARHGVRRFVATLKAANHRSMGLLVKLGFSPADASLLDHLRMTADLEPEADERVMVLSAPTTPPSGSAPPAAG